MVIIPFSFLPPTVLLRYSNTFMNPASFLRRLMPYLQIELDRANMKIEDKKYLAMCLFSTMFTFIILTILLTLLFNKLGMAYAGVLLALVSSSLILVLQVNYVKVVASRRIRKLDEELLVALRTLMIHLNSGVPLFEAMVIISKQKFGEVSVEFQKAVRKINAGVPAIDAMETMAVQNPSPYFRRTIWQMINGMKAGSTISQVMETVIDNLSKEQIIQIEKYGSQLNPLTMFYMIAAIIMPALGVTFLIAIASFVNLSQFAIQVIFWGLFSFVLFIQIMFSGIIKSKRPSLLGE